MRAVGAGFWLSDPEALKAQAEALARAQYARNKDAHDCALLYLALGRKPVLQGLFRTSNNKKVFAWKQYLQLPTLPSCA